MVAGPVFPAEIAELIAALAGHMVASFGPVDEDSAGRALLPFFESVFKVAVARAAVLGHHALQAIPHAATIAAGVLLRHVDNSLCAELGGAQPKIGVLGCLFPKLVPVVLVFEL